MKVFVIVGAVLGVILGGTMAIANEIGRYCEDINPYNNVPLDGECETCTGADGGCRECLKK